MKYSRLTHKGFILPTVLAISLAVILVMVSLFVLTSAAYRDSTVDYGQKLADEAAEAGSAYATACLNLSSHAQTWGAAAGKSDLAPNTDCNGDNTYPSNTYVYSDDSIRSYFTVGNLDYSLSFSAQISATGYAEVVKNGTVIKTYTSIRKKVITWPTEITAQMSASGTNRTCAIVNSKVYCWGLNAYGQLGDGRYIGSPHGLDDDSVIDSSIPVKVYQGAGVMGGKSITKIFAAQYHSCALSSEGKVYCWGYNQSGQLGNNSTTDSPVPVEVGGDLAGKVVTDIGGTNDVSCAIAESKIYCWGSNAQGLTGRNTTSGNTLTPSLVTASNTSTTLPTNYSATVLSNSGSRSLTMCAIADGKAYCWGDNSAGAIGDGSTNDRSVPTKVTDSGVLSGRTVTSISVDGYTGSTNGHPHTCAVASGAVFCWGENNAGQLGDNTTTDRLSPVAVVTSGVLNGKTIQDVKVGLRHSCVMADNGAYCWGYNSSGQVGDNSTTTRREPVTVTQQTGALTSSNVIAISAGANRSCAVINDGRTFCWGLNNKGQIGDGTTTDRRVPTESLFLRPLGNQYIF